MCMTDDHSVCIAGSLRIYYTSLYLESFDVLCMWNAHSAVIYAGKTNAMQQGTGLSVSLSCPSKAVLESHVAAFQAANHL